MKTYDYIVQLKSISNKRVDWISKLMLLITVAIFIANTVLYPGKHNIRPMIACLLIIAWLIFCYTQERRGVQPYFRFALFIAAVGWLSYDKGIWLSLVYLIAAVLERFVKFPEEIAFDETEVVMNSFPKKRYQWSELNNVVLKDGLLTIDFKNNKLIQRIVDSEVDLKVEGEFNQWVSKLISMP
jgi:hypothetical protein